VKKPVTNFAASVRARLLAETRSRKGDFQLTLQRYAAERFLFRLGVSSHRSRFVLKGAMLFVLWDPNAIRPTRDLDLAGYWDDDADSLAALIREVCSVPFPADGLDYAIDTLKVESIRHAAEYHGFRVTLDVRLAGAVIPFQIDVGFGDAIVPEPIDVLYPVLLDAEPPSIRAYPREAVIAEKLHAMVVLGEANTRFRDFFDIFALSSRFAVPGETLTAAIKATFVRRKSAALSPWPPALSAAFFSDGSRSEQWLRYLRRSKLQEAPADFAQVGERIREFLEAPVRAIEEGQAFASAWAPGGPWG
jgi:hypothetical protein